MNASPADQRRLLELADLDVRIRQADTARKTPPQAARVQELLAQRQTLSQELSARLAVQDEANAELKRIESDVAVVEARVKRDDERLRTVSNPKDAQGLESELASLARRKNDLEDAELEVMERLEVAGAAVAEQEALIAETNAEGATLSAAAKEHVAEATARLEAATRDRAAVAATVPADLVALYDKLATRSAGAALLRRQTCEGCRMMLSGTDLAALRQLAADAVATCPECGCILVRTEESGL
ncbi:zinc ribbon domain-containing protein [Microbacterium sp. ASV49]|uniref:C4-type zinc ribbon domain-containing protein n=1 Tax=Microbacterium candidum TaxID=3041922 RepID=A0ABT7MZ09_9MICO|nr:C4-type zinc ribbon domain-containing protein [Microbacterium sp. ASV49]MDL9979684.1 C4-type zinc ribbon domain-containing protein [Microbacterium sp. ASV49]